MKTNKCIKYVRNKLLHFNGQKGITLVALDITIAISIPFLMLGITYIIAFIIWKFNKSRE